MISNYTAMITFAVFVWCIAVIIYRNRTKTNSRQSIRGLFRFNDGKHVRSVDPIEVILSLDAHKEFRLDLHPTQAETGNQQALAICRDAIQSAFRVVPFTSPDQPGLSAVEMLRLLDAFQSYCMRQKKNTEPFPTSAVSTEPTSREFSEPTTKPSLASG